MQVALYQNHDCALLHNIIPIEMNGELRYFVEFLQLFILDVVIHCMYRAPRLRASSLAINPAIKRQQRYTMFVKALVPDAD
jgi:hypothetical protein